MDARIFLVCLIAAIRTTSAAGEIPLEENG